MFFISGSTRVLFDKIDLVFQLLVGWKASDENKRRVFIRKKFISVIAFILGSQIRALVLEAMKSTAKQTRAADFDYGRFLKI